MLNILASTHVTIVSRLLSRNVRAPLLKKCLINLGPEEVQYAVISPEVFTAQDLIEHYIKVLPIEDTRNHTKKIPSSKLIRKIKEIEHWPDEVNIIYCLTEADSLKKALEPERENYNTAHLRYCTSSGREYLMHFTSNKYEALRALDIKKRICNSEGLAEDVPISFSFSKKIACYWKSNFYTDGSFCELQDDDGILAPYHTSMNTLPRYTSMATRMSKRDYPKFKPTEKNAEINEIDCYRDDEGNIPFQIFLRPRVGEAILKIAYPGGDLSNFFCVANQKIIFDSNQKPSTLLHETNETYLLAENSSDPMPWDVPLIYDGTIDPYWEVLIGKENQDDAWEEIKAAIQAGKLWRVKMEVFEKTGSVLRIYTKNSEIEHYQEVFESLNKLRLMKNNTAKLVFGSKKLTPRDLLIRKHNKQVDQGLHISYNPFSFLVKTWDHNKSARFLRSTLVRRLKDTYFVLAGRPQYICSYKTLGILDYMFFGLPHLLSVLNAELTKPKYFNRNRTQKVFYFLAGIPLAILALLVNTVFYSVALCLTVLVSPIVVLTHFSLLYKSRQLASEVNQIQNSDGQIFNKLLVKKKLNREDIRIYCTKKTETGGKSAEQFTLEFDRYNRSDCHLYPKTTFFTVDITEKNKKAINALLETNTGRVTTHLEECQLYETIASKLR